PYQRRISVGHPSTDKIPSMLTPHEAILNRNAAELLGREKIQRLNAMGTALEGKGIDLAQQPGRGVDYWKKTGAPIAGYQSGSSDVEDPQDLNRKYQGDQKEAERRRAVAMNEIPDEHGGQEVTPQDMANDYTQWQEEQGTFSGYDTPKGFDPMLEYQRMQQQKVFREAQAEREAGFDMIQQRINSMDQGQREQLITPDMDAGEIRDVVLYQDVTNWQDSTREKIGAALQQKSRMPDPNSCGPSPQGYQEGTADVTDPTEDFFHSFADPNYFSGRPTPTPRPDFSKGAPVNEDTSGGHAG